MCGCRGRYEFRALGVLVEETGEGLGVEGFGGGGELDGNFGVGGGTVGCGDLAGGFAEEKFWCVQGLQRGGQREIFVEEQADGQEAGAGIAASGIEQVGVWGVEDEGWDGGVRDCEGSCERGSGSGAVGDDVACRDVS